MEAKLGGDQEALLQGLRATLKATAAGIQWRAGVQYDAGSGVDALVGAGLELPNLFLNVEGAFDGETFRTARLESLFGSHAATYHQALVGNADSLPEGVSYDPDLHNLSFANARDRLWNASANSPDGSWLGNVGARHGMDAWDKEEEPAPSDVDRRDYAHMGAMYTKRDFQLTFDAFLDQRGGLGTALTTDLSLPNHQVGGGELLFTTLPQELWKVGAYYGFSNPQEFQSFVGTYRYRSDLQEHQLGLIVEEGLGALMLRFESHTGLSQNGVVQQTDVMGMRRLDDNIAIGAGLRHTTDFAHQQDFIPSLILQAKKVPLSIGYDTGTKGFLFEILFPFGSGQRRASWR